MGELLFNATRMNEVLNRLDEIQEQLTSASNANSEKLNSIAANITGETVVSTLKTYSEKTLTISKEIIRLTNEMKDYLNGQIKKYEATETEAKETLSDVQNILNQLEGGA